jgi:hypothetical protein
VSRSACERRDDVLDAAAVVQEAVEAGLAAIADQSPGTVTVGGRGPRDTLELVVWRVAAVPARAARERLLPPSARGAGTGPQLRFRGRPSACPFPSSKLSG